MTFLLEFLYLLLIIMDCYVQSIMKVVQNVTMGDICETRYYIYLVYLIRYKMYFTKNLTKNKQTLFKEDL